MPLQNRVTPFGEIVSSPTRGTLMGNRGGCFHDEDRRLSAARWRSARWIACLLEYRGRQRTVMTPKRYTELFFLDEATAFSAGHRPCAECRRSDFRRFKAAWIAGNPELGLVPTDGIDAVDRRLHAERTDRARGKPTFTATLDSLPDGAIVTTHTRPEVAQLVWRGGMYRWSFDGYGKRQPAPGRETVVVLTPGSIVRAFAAGYKPLVHSSISELTA